LRKFDQGGVRYIYRRAIDRSASKQDLNQNEELAAKVQRGMKKSGEGRTKKDEEKARLI